MSRKPRTGRKPATADGVQIRITPGRRVTMTDVAQLAGCSQSTVSIVLNDTQGVMIAEATRERVRDAARQLGYIMPRPNMAATGEPRQIVVIFDYLATSPEAVESIDGVREAAWPAAHLVAAYQTLNEPKMEAQTVQVALSRDVAAIVYATIMTRKVTVPSALYACGKPVVLLNCYTDDRSFPCVLPGEAAGGHLATRTLIATGHRRIAHISGEMWMDAAKSRLEGYRQALAAANIPFDAELVKTGDWSTSAGYNRTLELLAQDKRPTAIFCSNDRMAVGAYEAIKERGLQIPDDVSIIGYDDQEIARHLSPTLTTVILPHREMGHWAYNTVTELGGGQSQMDRYPLVKLECTLVERKSIAAPAKGEGRDAKGVASPAK